MKYQTNLSSKILVLAVAFLFSACQKGAAENVNISPLPVISSAPDTNSSATPPPDSPIRKIDFENFTYPWTKGLTSDDDKTFTLKNGERPFVMNGQMGILFAKAEFGDVTNDGAEEAFISLSIQTGGSARPNMNYVYTLENKKPKLLWSFYTSDRAQGGFKRIYAENGRLVVETFGDNKFENDAWKFDNPKREFRGDCCPTAYTKIRFKWNGQRFIVEGTPEVFDYDDRNSNKKS